MIIRAATQDDLPAILQIQESAPEAAQWDPRDYLACECRVAELEAAVVGFAVARSAGPESEILNLAVAPGFRRQGIGRQLLSDLRTRHPGDIFLEVRESNQPARRFYERLGFAMVTKRLRYYDNPPDSAIVMKLLS